MGQQVCTGGVCMCTFGAAPSACMSVIPTVLTMTPALNIMDNKPMVNILPFAMCMSPSNPMVAAATAAALGVLTPMPCIPMTMAPWVPGAPTVLLRGMPTLNNSSKLMCNWGGVISITFAGQVMVQVP